MMQCVLVSHKLYKIKGGEHEFLIYMLDLCTQLLQNSPRLDGPIRRPAVDNIIRLTRRNHWPGKREAPDWKDMKSRTKKMQSLFSKRKKNTSRQ